MNDSRSNLIEILQLAYSGELAAAYAYRGHWNSVSDSGEKTRIQQIEKEEWHHRNLVGEMLQKIGSQADRMREIRSFVIGQVLRFGCHISGWFLPMYGAGKLESRNVREYETAARYAFSAGFPEFVECLLTMAEVEWEHEYYFRSNVLRHPWSRRVRMWPAPPPKESIRNSFYSESGKTFVI
jgi:rubrerythrin